MLFLIEPILDFHYPECGTRIGHHDENQRSALDILRSNPLTLAQGPGDRFFGAPGSADDKFYRAESPNIIEEAREALTALEGLLRAYDQATAPPNLSSTRH